jgi:hypothetical protein
MVGVLAMVTLVLGAPPTVSVRDADGALGRAGAPVVGAVRLDAALAGRPLAVVELRDGRASGPAVPAQYESAAGRLWWLLPSGVAGERTFAVVAADKADALSAARDPATGQLVVVDGGKPVFRYNRETVEPGPVAAQVAPGNRIYCRARSDYLHPLYGLHGEELTRDWSVDHPHHRGIYWAWPEVQYNGELGDLHALQKVFARPVGEPVLVAGPVWAEVAAESEWRWEDKEPIVRERAILRAYRAGPTGRVVDLRLFFRALVDGVTVARRQTKLYGGLNVRLAPVAQQQITFHTDPPEANPRLAWADLRGTFAGAQAASGLGILPRADNPDYPPEWVQYANLNWFQPTFPRSGARWPLRRDQPLVLAYRLWIRDGDTLSREAFADHWRAWHSLPRPLLEEQP